MRRSRDELANCFGSGLILIAAFFQLLLKKLCAAYQKRVEQALCRQCSDHFSKVGAEFLATFLWHAPC